MEKNRSTLSHFGGFIRLVILVLFVAILAFLVVRFMKNRQDTRTAERVSKISGPEEGKSKTKVSDEDKSTSKEANTSPDTSSEATIPSGIADDDATGAVESSKIPQAGIATDSVFTGAVWALIAYLYIKNRELKAERFQAT